MKPSSLQQSENYEYLKNLSIQAEESGMYEFAEILARAACWCYNRSCLA
ncbi:hypothetical protein FHV99_001640 [Ochrobactrum sp. P20RRXII]|nr:hypothetical protein [Ochrobactrum sp. P20RRXII]